jgi:hypothetical protein
MRIGDMGQEMTGFHYLFDSVMEFATVLRAVRHRFFATRDA